MSAFHGKRDVHFEVVISETRIMQAPGLKWDVLAVGGQVWVLRGRMRTSHGASLIPPPLFNLFHMQF